MDRLFRTECPIDDLRLKLDTLRSTGGDGLRSPMIIFFLFFKTGRKHKNTMNCFFFVCFVSMVILRYDGNFFLFILV